MLTNLVNYILPHCQQCKKRSLRHQHCQLCTGVCSRNMAENLRNNYAEHKNTNPSADAKYVCPDCFKNLELTTCGVTRTSFFRRDDQIEIFRASAVYRDLSPYHYCTAVESISSRGLELVITEEYEEFLNRKSRWAGCTKNEILRGYRITEEIGLIRVGNCADPHAVEEELRLKCLQTGGNGCIKFFWERHVHYDEFREIAGYGPKGNPYYRTVRETTTNYSGHAVAVVAIVNKRHKTS
jgi:hypothetical protein